jgi:hypothetical protein
MSLPTNERVDEMQEISGITAVQLILYTGHGKKLHHFCQIT